MSDFSVQTIDRQGAFDFFRLNIRKELDGQKRRYRMDELWYVATLLASFAETSRADTSSLPTASADLVELLDQLDYLSCNEPLEAEVLEIGAGYMLILAGFFRDHMRRRQDIPSFEQAGQLFFAKSASLLSKNPKKQSLLGRMSSSFPFWAQTCSDTSQTLCDERYVLKLN